MTKEDIYYRQLYPNQREVVDQAKEIIHSHGGVLLNAEIGFGKGTVALKTAEELGYTNILYITEPRLVKGIEHHSLMNVVTLPYSQLKLDKNSLLAVEKKVLELTKDIDESYFIIADEVHNVGNVDSQRGKLFVALRHRLKSNPFVAMSGSIKPTYNQQLVPFLYYVPSAHLNTDLKTIYKNIKSECDYYSPKVAIPHINRFATQTTDAHTDKLVELLDQFTVKAGKIRAGEITLYETVVTCPLPAHDFIKKMSRLKGDRAVELPNDEFIKYHASQFQRAADGYILKETLHGERSVLKFTKNPKIEAVKKILAKQTGKVIVLCAFRECAELVAESLGVLHYDVSLPKSKAEEMIQTFKDSAEHNVLVSTLSALSTGYNLDEADTIIYYSLFQDLKSCTQSFGRIDRATSTRDKHYYFLQLDWSWEKDKVSGIRRRMEEIAKDFGFVRSPVLKTIHSSVIQ
jgi:superfamily II DNA or RNA helicase